MEAANATIESPSGPSAKRCFVVSAFGLAPEEQRQTRQVLRHLIRKVLVPRDYDVVRADEIDDEGLITNHIIEHLLEDALVVADLSGANPNVFYEVAVRHAARKPIVHLITHGESIPFDVSNVKAIHYALDDPDLLEQAQDELSRRVTAIEESDGAGPNPISAAHDVLLLQRSDKPEVRDAGDLLASIGDLLDEVRALARHVAPGPQASDQHAVRPVATQILRALDRNGPMEVRQLSYMLSYSRWAVARAVHELAEQSRVIQDGHIVRLLEGSNAAPAV